jgi:hypothetical protein
MPVATHQKKKMHTPPSVYVYVSQNGKDKKNIKYKLGKQLANIESGRKHTYVQNMFYFCILAFVLL